MKYATVSVKFLREFDCRLEAAGVYTNKREFIKESCRRPLEALPNEPAIAALRLE